MTENESTETERVCPHCGAGLTEADAFCTACGKAPSGAMRPRGRGGARRRDARARTKGKLAWAAIILVLLGVIYSGVGLFTIIVLPGSEAVQLIEANLIEELGEDGVLELKDGSTVTVKEAVANLRSLPLIAALISLTLGAIYLGLFFWARVNPLPPMVIGLCIFLAGVLVTTILDPASFFRGIILKVIVSLALIVGVRAALTERAARERDAAAHA